MVVDGLQCSPVCLRRGRRTANLKVVSRAASQENVEPSFLRVELSLPALSGAIISVYSGMTSKHESCSQMLSYDHPFSGEKG